MNKPWNIDFDEFKNFRNIQKKKKAKKDKRKFLFKLYSFVRIYSRQIGILSIILLIIILILSLVFYPAYKRNFIKWTNDSYVGLQKLQEDDLKNIFNDSLGNNIDKNKLADIQNKSNDFTKKVDNKCNTTQPAVLEVSKLNKKLQKYCFDLKESILYIAELLQLENMVGNVDNFMNIIANANNADSAFKQLKSQYDTLIKTTKVNIIGIKFTNDNLISYQKDTIILVDKVNDEYTKLLGIPKDTSGASSNAVNTYKQKLSEIYKRWRDNVPIIVDKVSNDILTNSSLSARDFLDEYNKLSSTNFGIEENQTKPEFLK